MKSSSTGRTAPSVRLFYTGRLLYLIILVSLSLLYSSRAVADARTEVEPNETKGAALHLENGEYGVGNINPASDEDMWYVSDYYLFALATGFESTTGFDIELTMIGHGPAGTLDYDNNDGPGVSAVIAGTYFTSPGGGYLKVSCWNDVNTITPYELHAVTVYRGNKHREQEPNDTPATAETMSSQLVEGTISTGNADYFSFFAKAGERVVVIVNNDPDDNDITTRTRTALLAPDGTTVLSSEDSFPGDGSSTKPRTVSTTGTHYVKIEPGILAGSGEANYEFVVIAEGRAVPYGACCDGARCSLISHHDCSAFDEVYHGDYTSCGDSDGDTVATLCDNCPGTLNADQADTDDDAVGDACDACPDDSSKTAAGVCGCGSPDVDVDEDGDLECQSPAETARDMLARDGILLITDYTNDRVMAFDPQTGDLVDPDFIPEDGVNLSSPEMAILGPDQQKILVADDTLNVIQAYNLNGDYLGVYAPAGGADLAMMEGSEGITLTPSGNLLVAVPSGDNEDAVIEFDKNGNLVGQFVTAAAGGINSPSCPLFWGDYLLVSANSSDAVHRYSAATGTYIDNLAEFEHSPNQIALSSGNTLLVAMSGPEGGVFEYTQDGSFIGVSTPLLTPWREGVAELGNGNILIAGRAGVHEIDRSSNLIETKIDVKAAYISFAKLTPADDDSVEEPTVEPTPDPTGPDLCPEDPDKNGPGTCGCGKVDIDSDSNGIFDCLLNAELKWRLARMITLIKSLKSTATDRKKKNRRRKKAQRKSVKEIRLLAKGLVPFVNANTTELIMIKTIALTKLSKRARKQALKAVRTGALNFKKRKKKALRTCRKINTVVADQS